MIKGNIYIYMHEHQSDNKTLKAETKSGLSASVSQ